MTMQRRNLVQLAALALAAGAPLPALADDPYAAMPSQLTLMGTVRDFRAREQSGGHTDFEWAPTAGYAHYAGEVADQLGQDGLPVFAGTGFKVTTEWKDSSGRNIIAPRSYINARPGDYPGARSSSQGGSLHTAAAFNQWFRDVPSMNQSRAIGITLNRQPNTPRYVFDDTLDQTYRSRGGFFPINGQLYGNYSNTGKNFHFTYMIDTHFTYQAGQGHVFTFTGDDDVWVFIDGKLVIDLGGVHAAVQQTIELDRLNWLVNGQSYGLKFFFAERHTTQSNFRIETTLFLRNVEPPPTTALAD